MRTRLADLLPTLLAVTGVFMAWRALSLITGSPHPIIVVISESMAPAFHRGDVCLLWNHGASINVGDIPVVWFEGRELPMVHRVIESHWQHESTTTISAT
jgi:signal peptidase